MSNFLKTYESTYKKNSGIPGIEMNRPLSANTLPGDVGLELEIEGINLPRDGSVSTVFSPKSGQSWQAITDGSLRGEAREYILTGPIFVEEVPDMVMGLYKLFGASKTTLVLSNRCSTHVHINMRARRINGVTAALALWTSFEEALIEWCGENRKANHFCLSAKDASGNTVEAWNNYLKTGASRFSSGLKYSALNVLPLFNKGSLEVRCGPASEEPAKIVAWSSFIHRLLTFAADTYVNPRSLAYDLSERGATAIFADICKDIPLFFQEVMELNPDFDNKALTGFRRCQAIVMEHPWDEWIELIDKTYIPDPFAKKSSL